MERLRLGIKLIFVLLLVSVFITYTHAGFFTSAKIYNQIFTTEEWLNPEDVVDRVGESLTASDSVKISSLMDSSLEYVFDANSIQKGLEKLDSNIVEAVPVGDIEKVSENWAVVDYKITFKNGETRVFELVLRRDKHGWRVFGTLEKGGEGDD